MARFRTEIPSVLSPSDAFAKMAAFERVPEWDPNTSASARVGDEAGGGGQFDVTTTFGGRELVVRYRTTEHEPPRRFVVEASLPNGIALKDEITVAADGAGSRVTYDARIIPTGLWKLADPVFQVIFRRVGRRAVEPLTRYLSA